MRGNEKLVQNFILKTEGGDHFGDPDGIDGR
jgi:hypothetical protein